MKAYSYILCCLAISIGYSQNTSSPFKGATTITITTNDSGEELYKRFGKYLAMKGYRIKRSDREFLNLRTEPRETSKYNYSYIVNATVNKSNVVITLDWREGSAKFVETDATSFFSWEYQTGKKEVREVIYDDLMSHLISFPKISIAYSR